MRGVSVEDIIVIVGSSLLIGFIVWWFFGKREGKQVESVVNGSEQEIGVTVDGGYLPNVVVLKKDIPAKIVFHRKDFSACFSHVVFPDFGINEELPVGEKFAIEIDTSTVGEFSYACGMNMFHGKVIVK